MTPRGLTVGVLALLVAALVMMQLVRGGQSWRSGEDECPRGRKLNSKGKCVCENGWDAGAKKCKTKKDDGLSRPGRGLKDEGEGGGGGGWRDGVITCFSDTTFADNSGGKNASKSMVAVHEKDWGGFKGKTLKIRFQGKEFNAKVRDYCNATNGNCIKNIEWGKNGKKPRFLLDVHRDTLTAHKISCNILDIAQWKLD